MGALVSAAFEQRVLFERLLQLYGATIESVEMERDGSIVILFAERRGELWVDAPGTDQVRVNLP